MANARSNPREKETGRTMRGGKKRQALAGGAGKVHASANFWLFIGYHIETYRPKMRDVIDQTLARSLVRNCQ